MKLLITSFGPFAEFKENPSNVVMQMLQQQMKSLEVNHELTFDTLEVSYKAVDLFEKEYENSNYDLVIHLGVATNDNILRFEVRARNERSGKDVQGNAPERKEIIQNMTDLETTLNRVQLAAFCARYAGKARISDDAGTYLCNYVYFNSLINMGTSTKVLFIHIADFINRPDATTAMDQTEIIYQLIAEFLAMQTLQS
jgi:pyroglutamyl-peptidase